MNRRGRWRMSPEAPPGTTNTVRKVASWLPWVLLAVGVFVDLALPAAVTLSSLFAAAPLVAAPFLTARVTQTLAVVAVAVHTALVFARDYDVPQDAVLRSTNVLTVAVLAVGINYLARRSTAELATVRSVAEVAQLAVLPVPPRSVGELEIAARYEAAQVEARIGGDLYALQETPFGVRMLVGDVRGKGLQAVETLSVVVGTFREAAEQERTLVGASRRLERALQRQAELRPDREAAENFMTAVLAECPADRQGLLRLVNCGHPPPLLQHPDGTVRVLEPRRYTLPLGLASVLPSGEEEREMDEETFPRGGTLLFYTDGVSEARDARGVFFDPAAWLRKRRPREPEALLQTLLHDVKAYSGGKVADDMALLAVARRGSGRAAAPRRASDETAHGG